MSEYLLDKLNQYGASDFYPLHMPGHKRRVRHFGDPFAIDITEIDGFDDLHHAQGILLEAQQRAARLYGAEETYYLVNGSTCGILAAVAASTTRGGGLLMARNSHRSCYHAAYLNDLRVTYVYPPILEMGETAEDLQNVLDEGVQAGNAQGVSGERVLAGNLQNVLDEGVQAGNAHDVSDGKRRGNTTCRICGSICPEEVREVLRQHSDIRAVLVTSPTYDGVVSDIRAIAEIAHDAGAALIVDEAHGAHFGLHSYFPKSALSCGADIVINSLHKTLPSLTQTALLHVQGGRVNRGKLRKFLDIYQTSSPSYVLMAGMDACIRLLEERGSALFDAFAGRLERMRGELRKMRVLRLVPSDFEYMGSQGNEMIYAFDRSKILISTGRSSLTGPALADLLRERYHLEPEMAAADYVTALMTVADTQEGFDRLTAALLAIDAGLNSVAPHSEIAEKENAAEGVGRAAQGARYPHGEEVLRIQEAEESPSEDVLLAGSAGRVSAEYVYLYPPGIPLLVPGERISEELLQRLREERDAGLVLRGLADPAGERIRVVRRMAQTKPENHVSDWHG